MGKVQFIAVSGLPDAPSAKAQRLAHSHAARAAHAKARRLRMAEYQAGKGSDPGSSPRKAVVDDQEDTQAGLRIRPTAAVMPSQDVIPSPSTTLSAGRRDPFNVFSTPMGTKEHFLFDHYVNSVIPYLTIHCSAAAAEPGMYMEMMPKEWVRLAVSDKGFLQGLLLASSRHLSASLHPCAEMQLRKQEFYEKLAMQYKVACVQALIKAISNGTLTGPVSDSTLAKVMMLALDEIWLRDFEMFRRHVFGAIKLVEFNGGPETFGMQGLLARMFHKFVKDSGMVDLLGAMHDPCERVAVQMCGSIT
ncbi:hypothetical protein GQ53DRAFT_746607 [Thozetella sp. PMI_491]|nr:hypothetical protein GQ53DRAFT_746607 [Thozetella sp. PMI_491]